ncbi:MAG TPA: hypothetical protein VM261_22345 [Kofleriaceae bacterium]|nr:hypothetical protein [Kofleriaceae bacterium]
MKTTILLVTATVAVAVVVAPDLAHAGQPLVCKEAAIAPEPTREQLEACVRPAPLSIEVALGYAIGGSIMGFARADKRLGPLWATGRIRYDVGGVGQLDALGGLVIWDSYGVAWDTWSTAPSGGMRTVISNKTVMRRALVLGGGLKGVLVPEADDPMSSAKSGLTPVAAAGLEYHSVGGFRDHAIREMFALYNLSSGKMGAQLSWHEAIPPLGPWAIGMELAMIPTENNPDFYLGLEVGYAVDL